MTSADLPAVTEEAVLASLSTVEDPEIHLPITDLDMVRSVEIDGSRVRLLIALTVPGCPLKARIESDISAALEEIGVESVEIDFTSMTPEELHALRVRLQGDRAPAEAGGHDGHAHGHAHGESTPRSPLMDPHGPTKVIAVSSGKGGVGKSSLTTNLAVALAQKGKRVALIDADVYGFSIPKMLGIDRDPVVVDEMIMPPEAHGVAVVSMGYFVDEDQAVIWRGPMLHKALEQFITDVYWGEPDYLLIDMPPGTGDIAISMSQYLPHAEMIVVTTPQPAAQRVAQRSAAMARKLNMALLGVVENMSWFTGDDSKRYEIFGSGGGELLAKELGVPLLAQIPLAPALRVGADEGRPIVVSDPGHEAALAISGLADSLVSEKPRRIRLPQLSVKPA